jgi:hypothetical protein
MLSIESEALRLGKPHGRDLRALSFWLPTFFTLVSNFLFADIEFWQKIMDN